MMEHVSNIDSSGYVSSSDDGESSDDNNQELYGGCGARGHALSHSDYLIVCILTHPESPSLLQDEGVMVGSRQPTRYRKASSKVVSA